MKAYLLALATAVAVASAPAASAQGLRKVNQTIFGMDCAPCAHGLSKALNELPGVESVTVSLNQGYAEVFFEPGSPAELADIHQITRDNGFTPKGARVIVEGVLEPGQPPQVVAGSSRYPLALADADATLATAGQPVVVAGTVAEDASVIDVSGIELRQPSSH